MLTLASGSCVAASTASVAGVVRDAEGAAQAGAVVQVLAADSSAVAMAITDIYGRYRIANLVPGKYEVRATAALFLPATRWNLRLATGMRATVNLTMNLLADPAVWLPAERRQPDEPSDDWTWTLRSAANRPILRVLDPADDDRDKHSEPMQIHAAVMGGDAGFGDGGVRSVIALDRVPVAGEDVVLQAELAAPGAGFSGGLPAEVDAGYERAGAFGDASRMVVSYASHPELASTGGSSGNTGGMQWMRMASAERMRLGDAVDVEAGGTVYAIHSTGYALTTQPFLRVTVHPGEVWAVRYRLSTSHEVEDFDGLNSVATDLPVAAMSGGRMCTESGTHQEIAVSRKAGSGVVRVAIYHDALRPPEVGGTGATDAAELAASNVVMDTATGSFRFLGTGYSASGMSVALAEPLTSSVWASLEYASGAGLATTAGNAAQLAEVSNGLRAEAAGTTTAAMTANMTRTGTKLRASYRWQPKELVTAVNPYAAMSDQAFLSFYVRQALHWGDKLPPGLEATVDVTNLLAEGYHPFLSADGRTLFLAQAPRTVRAGLAFTF